MTAPMRAGVCILESASVSFQLTQNIGRASCSSPPGRVRFPLEFAGEEGRAYVSGIPNGDQLRQAQLDCPGLSLSVEAVKGDTDRHMSPKLHSPSHLLGHKGFPVSHFCLYKGLPSVTIG